ncbi:MAG: DUF3368 domain-containing protein [Bryobacterales bacterium]|nr:DUF3368 domain-containing protein [Bryobacterales bacterium]
MLIVADSSPLRYLVVLGAEQILPAIFGQVWIPGAVLAELSASGAPQQVRDLVSHRPDWLRVGEPAEESLDGIDRQLDPGERSALALAKELAADLVLIDEAEGRREAARLGIPMTGTLGVLRLAAERGMIDVPRIVDGLRTSGFYLNEGLIRFALGPWM